MAGELDVQRIFELAASSVSREAIDRYADWFVVQFTALGLARRGFPIPVAAFRDLIDGVRMDVDGAVYETFDDLVVYCRRVAGSIGRLSLAVFGSKRICPPRNLASASAMASTVGASTYIPELPSSTASAAPPRRAASDGTPLAAASR